MKDILKRFKGLITHVNNKNMKVYVCIPSFNESNNIENITKTIDNGLKRLSVFVGSNIEAKIINIDSNSEDNTVKIFRKTKTFYPKKSVILKKPRGKGKNLIYFLNLSKKDNVDFCLTIDADVSSAKDDWIIKMLKPLINKKADFVTPSYKRSRFEGSTTNHLAYPIVSIFAGKLIRQPIAGDFAFNKRSILILTKNYNLIKSVYNYGIDIFLVLNCLNNNLKHSEIKLDKKIHNPSFNKLEYMFPQVASATLFSLRLKDNLSPQKPKDKNTSNNILLTTVFPHKKFAIKLRDKYYLFIKSLNKNDIKWLSKDVIEKIIKNKSKTISLEEWVLILSSWLNYGLKKRGVSEIKLANQLLPFFVLRATTFWIASETKTSIKVEYILKKQILSLYNKIVYKKDIK